MRRLLLATLLLPTLLAWTVPAAAQIVTTAGRTPGIGVMTTPKLAPGFDVLPYVNPDAPKGGDVVVAELGSFDSFNPFILRGTAPVSLASSIWVRLAGGGGGQSGIPHTWESLLVGTPDEASAAYGLLAGTIDVAPDKLSVAFDIRPEARFADGTPVLAEDVVWTYETLLAKGRPALRVVLADVAGVEATGERRVVFRFRNTENKELPLVVGALPVLPKHWWAGRDFSEPLKEPPMGSGPYRVSAFEFGRSVTYERRADWWARDLPIARGTNNFGRVRIDYYRDNTVQFQAFRAGQADIWVEYISRNWATGYDFPAVRNGLVKRQSIPHHLPTGMQAWAINTRRPQLADVRVREALGQLFDFEWTNKTLFFSSYKRTDSYFANTDLASSGVPGGAELALLEPFRAQLPPELFTQPFKLPVSDGSGNNREGFRRALELMKEAGWTLKDRKLVNGQGEQMRFVVLGYDASLERVSLPYVQQLQRLGIDATVRTVDPAQYERLMDSHDFDVTTFIWPGTETPGTEQIDNWTCDAAKADGSSNVAGVCSPVVDALVKQVVQATTREQLTPAVHALDRVLLWGWYAVPGWEKTGHDIAWWDRFGRPDQPVRQGFAFDTWWIDPARAAANDAARASQ